MFSYYLQILRETFFFLRRIERDMIKKICCSSWKVTLLLSHFHENSSSGSRVVPFGRRERDRRKDGHRDMTKLSAILQRCLKINRCIFLLEMRVGTFRKKVSCNAKTRYYLNTSAVRERASSRDLNKATFWFVEKIWKKILWSCHYSTLRQSKQPQLLYLRGVRIS